MKNSLLLLLFSLLSVSALAQESFVSLGGDVFGNTASMSYSIGQLNYLSTKTGTHLIVEGVQQPELKKPTGIVIYKNLYIDAWPNPTTNRLHLQINGELPQKIEYVMFDVKGQYQFSKRLTNSSVDIDVSSLLPGVYMLNVMADQQVIKNFKIIKLQ
ncbi:MAG: T9SS type A sorting domain-containing protein [Chitinophagales bacterium]|nr:T9SS type A sorting domain-containing protein [Chitinophagales bacterium]